MAAKSITKKADGKKKKKSMAKMLLSNSSSPKMTRCRSNLAEFDNFVTNILQTFDNNLGKIAQKVTLVELIFNYNLFVIEIKLILYN